jgi:hypothetical protein
MRRHLPAAVMAALILTAGTIHGRWTNRWARATELQHAVDHLGRLPLAFGDWEGRENVLDENERKMYEASEAAMWLTRSYVHRKTGEALSLLVLCGPPGPTAAHSPEACYGGGGYELSGPPEREEIRFGTPPETAVFQAGNFRRSDAASSMGLRIYWSYRGGSAWEVPYNTRLAFARYPALYKVYVVRQMAMAQGLPPADEVGPRFIRDLMPELEKLLPHESGQPTSP